jgi:CBS domain-containing protein
MVAKIKEFMTPTPHTVTRDLPLRECIEMMDHYQVRHLPVEYAGKLVGILIYSDVKNALSFQGSQLITAESAMLRQPYCVSPDAELPDVVFEMSDTRCDYAVIQDGDRIIGIFTAIDALRILGEVFRYQIVRAA